MSFKEGISRNEALTAAKKLLKEEREYQKIRKETELNTEDTIDEDMKQLYQDKQFYKQILKLTNYLDNVENYWQEQPFFYDKTGQFWIWKTNKYETIDETDIMNSIENQLGLHGETVSSQTKSNYLESFRRIGRKHIPEKPNTNWVQFKNTAIDISTGEKMSVTPKYFFCNPIPHEIGGSEETPNIDRIFTEWVGKEKELLYEIAAYCLLQDYPLHRIFCFIGNGMNGKSKYLELLRKLVGDENVTTTELDTLMRSRFEITRLHKKLICQVGETDFAEMGKTSILKKLSGGDMIGFEYKRKNPFEDHNYAKIIIATNNLPTTTDKTDGFYRRWIIVDFNNQFSEKKDVLSDIPDEEYPNLCLKLVSTLKRLILSREFTGEGTIGDRKKRFEERSNPFEKFWKEHVNEYNFDGSIPKWEFKNNLDGWCKQNRFREIGERDINKKMKQKDVTEGRENMFIDGKNKFIRVWKGINWK